MTHPADSIGRIFLEAAVSLERAAAALVAPPRALHVVEFRDEAGNWHPLCGDAYADEDEARRVAERSTLQTRIVRYVPERGAP